MSIPGGGCPCLLILLSLVWLVGGDIPRCDRHTPNFTTSPFCLPDDYNKDLVPPTDGPLHINVDIWVFEVSRIDDIQLSMTFELYFDLRWNESRLVINESSPEWEVDGSVMGSTNFVKDMWLPDIQILNLKQFQKRQIVTDVAGVIIFKSKSVLYTVSTEAVISCPMKFSAYPLDHQECKFNVGSYIHDASQIYFTGTFGHDVVNQRAQQYEINITALRDEDTTLIWANRNYSLTGFKINLIRRRTPVLLQTYLPSGLFVVVSWISFIVPPEIVPGRMALLVTLFLVLVNIFNSVMANAPKSEGLTAVETWVVMCILHVFCVLSEYAIILKIIQTDKQKARKAIMDNGQRQVAASTSSASSLDESRRTTTGCLCLCRRSGHKRSQSDFCLDDGGNAMRLVPTRRILKHRNRSSPIEHIFETFGQSDEKPEFVCQQHRAEQQQQQQQQQVPLVGGGVRCHDENHDKSSSLQHYHRPISSSATQDIGVGNESSETDNGPSEKEAAWAKLDMFPATRCLTNRKLESRSSAERREKMIQRYENIDRVAMWLFPMVFFLFNICYWSYYLLLDDVLQDLWMWTGDCEKVRNNCDAYAYSCSP